ncbi:RHS repeat-associated core domain-containing protein [Chryseobacterium jejuense]|uniref:RHS repeat domain-containing protein n=1 Tax=Chryseobacterium jejuense TaxID=445960 RepID=UPI00293D2704|nr:RHS repeat-associated core domain-containing protein [Chryseobacterium jejuense]
MSGIDSEVTQSIAYFPSGEVFVENHKNSPNAPYKFNGKEQDDETGYYYYGARYYNPRVSLWLNVDPLVEKTMQPYTYGNNNPIVFTDPDGRAAYPPLGYRGNSWIDSTGDFVRSIGGEYINKRDGKMYDNGTRGMRQTTHIQSLYIPAPSIANETNFTLKIWNRNNSEGVVKNYKNTRDIIVDYLAGTGPENAIINSGGALEQVKNLESVKANLKTLLGKLNDNGGYHIGETEELWHNNGSIFGHGTEALQLIDAIAKMPVNGKASAFDSDLINNPMSAVGSYGMSVRVNSDYKTATVGVYNSLSLGSGLDNMFGSISKPRNAGGNNKLTNTYQIYIWTVPLKNKK